MKKKIPIPKEVQRQANSVYALVFGTAVVGASSYELYRRLELGGEKKVQVGEILEDGTLREFSEYEKRQRDTQSLFSKWFGDESNVPK